ncbi:hypothetical protein LINPERHAP2_LOCUS4586, partial [Linum perenne]
VWARLPGLPLEYFDHAILKHIGDRIGKTVRIDNTTLEGCRGNFARISVEVDLSKPLLTKYRLRRRVRRIEYEGLHTICFNCGCYGHKDESCKQVPEVEASDVQPNVFANPIFQGAIDSDIRPEVEEDFGPWMQVKKNRRRTQTVGSAETGAAKGAAPREVPPVVTESDKNNRFAIFGNKDNQTDSKEHDHRELSEPLVVSSKEKSEEMVKEGDKENVDPSIGASTSSQSVLVETALAVDPLVGSSLPAQEFSIPPARVSDVQTGGVKSVQSFEPTEPLVSVHPSHSSNRFNSSPGTLPPDTSAKKVAAPSKGGRGTKYKSKESAALFNSKVKAPASQSVTRYGISDMEV